MLNIDDKDLKVIKQSIYIGNFTYNDEEGYNICIALEFVNKNNDKGYLNLDAGFETKNDIKVFLNKEYSGIPFHSDNQFIFFEVFDTEKFLDTEIESNITINYKDIVDNKVETSFKLNDELIKIKFDGYLEIINKID